jgi:hypothetical protein
MRIAFIFFALSMMTNLRKYCPTIISLAPLTKMERASYGNFDALLTAHLGPLTPKDKDWNDSSYNVLIEWENGEITTEPLAIIAADDPITCAIYARDHSLLELDGWKRSKGLAKR